jgi:hypothetical protein
VTSTPTASHASTPARQTATPVVARPSCGQYCEDAGMTAGEGVPGYPCPKPVPGKAIGCLSCPHQGCITLLDDQATAQECSRSTCDAI